MGKKKMHCLRGHERTPENEGKGGECLLCEKEQRQSKTPETKAKEAAYQREWRKNNPDRCRAILVRYKYGLEPLEFAILLEKQGNKCLICEKEFSDMLIESKPYIDHCHKTKMIRGVLCMKCNSGLGQFEDNPERLRKAADYLDSSLPPKTETT